jgi:hypothetical protein
MNEPLTWRRSKDGARWEAPPYFIRKTAHGYFAYFNPWTNKIMPATREKVAMVKTLDDAKQACINDYKIRVNEGTYG